MGADRRERRWGRVCGLPAVVSADPDTMEVEARGVAEEGRLQRKGCEGTMSGRKSDPFWATK